MHWLSLNNVLIYMLEVMNISSDVYLWGRFCHRDILVWHRPPPEGFLRTAPAPCSPVRLGEYTSTP